MKKTIAMLSAMMLLGCANPFFRNVDGTDFEVAVAFPNEDTFKVQLMHYLSGEKVTVRDPSVIEYTFSHSETNSYLGLIETQTYRESRIKVSPTSTNTIEKAGN